MYNSVHVRVLVRVYISCVHVFMYVYACTSIYNTSCVHVRVREYESMRVCTSCISCVHVRVRVCLSCVHNVCSCGDLEIWEREKKANKEELRINSNSMNTYFILKVLTVDFGDFISEKIMR